MHKSLTLAVVLVVAFAAVTLGSREVAAAPVGAAQGLQVIEQSCLPNGTVRAVIAWQPSGWGDQWADMSRNNDNFTFGWWNAGPFPSWQNIVIWEQLVANAPHFARVNTFTVYGWLPSDTLSFRTISCGVGQFTPPGGLAVQPLSATSFRFTWQRGADNQFFCLDLALSQADLLNFRGSWRNFACGSTTNVLDLHFLDCDTVYFWRVYSWGNTGRGHSPVASFRTGSCGVTPPHNLRSQTLGPDSIRFDWDRGAGNQWFCLDLAGSQADLVNLRGTWWNLACGTTATTVTVTGLACDTIYFWRVFTWGPGGAAHSVVQQARTAPCGFTPPGNLRSQVLGPSSVRVSWDPGRDNRWFCVDLARSQQELMNFSGSWFNAACGTTQTTATITDLACNTTYFWRVFAWGPTGAGHSSVASFRTQACAPGAQIQPAPIDAAEIRVLESNPPQYILHVVAGLPSGCASPHSHDVQRQGNTIRVRVLNQIVGDVCTAIYSTYELDINLGSNFTRGQVYTVIVNDRTLTFRAQ